MICRKCKKDKPKTEYRYGHRACKDCDKKKKREDAKKIKKKEPWRRSYLSARIRCNSSKCLMYKRYGGRGIKFLMTRDDFKKLWFRDKAYKMGRPTIHRINNDGNYEVSNCKYVELSENSLCGRNPICLIKKCNLQVEGRGLCKRHYGQYWQFNLKDKILIKARIKEIMPKEREVSEDEFKSSIYYEKSPKVIAIVHQHYGEGLGYNQYKSDMDKAVEGI